MIAARDAWGPFASNLDEAEQRARLRSLRAIVRLSTGQRGQALADLLRRAETDPAQLEPALRELDRLAALDRRQVLASFAALDRGGR